MLGVTTFKMVETITFPHTRFYPPPLPRTLLYSECWSLRVSLFCSITHTTHSLSLWHHVSTAATCNHSLNLLFVLSGNEGRAGLINTCQVETSFIQCSHATNLPTEFFQGTRKKDGSILILVMVIKTIIHHSYKLTVNI